jgi:hypothetical protein
MSMSFYGRFVFILPVFNFLVSCSPPDYTSEIAEVDGILKNLDAAEQEFRSVALDSAFVIERIVDRDMKLVSNRFNGELSRSRAESIQSYRGIKSVVKKTKPIAANVQVEFPAVRQQLEMLKQALNERATRDRDNNRMNRDYVNRAIAAERMAADAVIEQSRDVRFRVEKAIFDYALYYPQVAAFLDSLRTINP